MNRSDGERFHVTLFAGPDPWPKISGGFHNDRVLCNFVYAHDVFGHEDHTAFVAVPRAGGVPEVILFHVEHAADKLAELLSEGSRPTATYTFNGRDLTPGF